MQQGWAHTRKGDKSALKTSVWVNPEQPMRESSVVVAGLAFCVASQLVPWHTSCRCGHKARTLAHELLVLPQSSYLGTRSADAQVIGV